MFNTKFRLIFYLQRERCNVQLHWIWLDWTELDWIRLNFSISPRTMRNFTRQKFRLRQILRCAHHLGPKQVTANAINCTLWALKMKNGMKCIGFVCMLACMCLIPLLGRWLVVRDGKKWEISPVCIGVNLTGGNIQTTHRRRICSVL